MKYGNVSSLWIDFWITDEFCVLAFVSINAIFLVALGSVRNNALALCRSCGRRRQRSFATRSSV